MSEVPLYALAHLWRTLWLIFGVRASFASVTHSVSASLLPPHTVEHEGFVPLDFEGKVITS